MRRLYILLLLILVSLSCSSKKNYEEAVKIYDESMKIHDEVMPRMDDLFSLRQQLNHKIDSLKSDSATNIVIIDKMREAIEHLQMADDAMMDWMHTTQVVPGSGTESENNHHGAHQPSQKSKEEIISVQNDQLNSIKKIQNDTDEAIKNARQLLGVQGSN